MDTAQLNGHKRAVIYARVSTDDQRSNYSIPTQIAACRDYAGDKQRQYSIVGDHFVDAGTGQDAQPDAPGAVRAYVDDYSSREISRPALDAALSYLELVGFDVLIVHALDRLARDPYIRQTLENEFKNRGARVEFVLGNYEASAEGEVRKDLDATFGKWENAKRVERSTRGKIGKAQRGIFVHGRAPFGYEVDADAPGGLQVVETQAAVVRDAFDLCANQGYSYRGIASEFTARGIPTPEGNSHWRKQTIAFMLTNETYAGIAYYNKSKIEGKREIPRDRSEWIPITVQRIVEPALFEAAQRRRDHNRDLLRRAPLRFYLLSGMVQCAICGRAYVSQAIASTPGEPHYRYYVHRKRDGACRQGCMSARKLEERVWREVSQAILDPQHAMKGYADAREQQEATYRRKRAHLETLERNLIKLQQRMDKLNRMYSDPDINMTKAEYLTQKTGIDGERSELQQKITNAQEELKHAPQPADLETFEAFTAKIRAQLKANVDPKPEKKRQLLQILHVKVLINPEGEPEVTGWYTPEFSQSSNESPYGGQKTITFRLILARDDALAKTFFGTSSTVTSW